MHLGEMHLGKMNFWQMHLWQMHFWKVHVRQVHVGQCRRRRWWRGQTWRLQARYKAPISDAPNEVIGNLGCIDRSHAEQVRGGSRVGKFSAKPISYIIGLRRVLAEIDRDRHLHRGWCHDDVHVCDVDSGL